MVNRITSSFVHFVLFQQFGRLYPQDRCQFSQVRDLGQHARPFKIAESRLRYSGETGQSGLGKTLLLASIPQHITDLQIAFPLSHSTMCR